MHAVNAPRALLALVAVGTLTTGLQASDRYDNQLEVPYEYPTINKAISAADADDVILVYPGDYTEDLLIESSVTIRGVTVDGRRPTLYNDRDEHRIEGWWYGRRPTANFTNMNFKRHSGYTRARKTGFSAAFATVNFDRCTFEGLLYESSDEYGSGNTSFGGAVRISRSDGRFTSCSFTRNKAVSRGTEGNAYGGAIEAYQSRLEVEHCTFTLNQARVELASPRQYVYSQAQGGAIFCSDSRVTLQHNNFYNNLTVMEQTEGRSVYSTKTYSQGGAVALSGCDIREFYKCYLFNNEARNRILGGTSTGGALEVAHYDSRNLALLEIESCFFGFNMADAGGAIFDDTDTKLILANCTFYRNTARQVAADFVWEYGCRWFELDL